MKERLKEEPATATSNSKDARQTPIKDNMVIDKGDMCASGCAAKSYFDAKNSVRIALSSLKI